MLGPHFLVGPGPPCTLFVSVLVGTTTTVSVPESSRKGFDGRETVNMMNVHPTEGCLTSTLIMDLVSRIKILERLCGSMR